MTVPHHEDDASRSNSQQPTLEDIDLLNRKYHHLHDEEIARAVTNVFHGISDAFKGQKRNDQQQSAG